MPRWYRRRRTTRRRTRRSSVMPLVALLLIALVLLIVTRTSPVALSLPQVQLPPLPNITIPITGLPDIKIPTAQIPLTLEPGTLVPQIGIAGTPVPAGGEVLAPRTKENGCQLNDGLPDPACTPGATVESSEEVICRPGYTGPAREISDSAREEVYRAYGIQNPENGDFRVDRLVPPILGGSNDLANLWPLRAAPRPGFAEKDQLAVYLHDQVCWGNMSLTDARRQLAGNWVEVWNRMPK